MSPPFSLSFDPAIAAVHVTLTGQWTMAVAQAYMDAVVANMQGHKVDTMPRKALFDLRECALHGREVADALAAFHARTTPDMDRVALIVGAVLEGLQAKRISSGRDARVFTTVDDARQWLAAD